MFAGLFVVFALRGADDKPLLMNTGSPIKTMFDCTESYIEQSGLSCSDEDPCPIYLELDSASAGGEKIFVAGNTHSSSSTLHPVLLMSEDGGVSWKDVSPAMDGAAIDQAQILSDGLHGWAAGETQYPLPRDPFFLITADGGAVWKNVPVSDEGGAGSIQRFWFDSVDHGEVIVDGGRTAPGGRYALYETRNGGLSWTTVSLTAQAPMLRNAPKADISSVRVVSDAGGKSVTVQRLEGERWVASASFAVNVAACKAPVPKKPAVEPADPNN